jgi:histone deacetylase 1/2
MNTGGNSLPSQSCPDGAKRRVCYYYDRCIAGVDYGEDHVMVPRRVDMAHALIRSYGLLGDMTRLRTRPATDAEISGFHGARYVGLLRDLTPEGFGAGGEVARRARGCNVGAVSTDGRSVDNPPSPASGTTASATPAGRWPRRARSPAGRPTSPSTGPAACTTRAGTRPAASAT